MDTRVSNVENTGMDALRAAELAIEIQLERMHVIEAINARDAVAKRLADAYVTINQKNNVIEGLKNARRLCDLWVDVSSTHSSTPSQEKEDLNIELANFANTASPVIKIVSEAPPDYEDIKALSESEQQSLVNPVRDNKDLVQSTVESATPNHSRATTPKIGVNDLNGLGYNNIVDIRDAVDIAKARHSLLASLPLPSEIPDDSLKPIVIPSPFTLHEFLGNASGSLRASLSNYRVFQQSTTSWCPDREEHGYSLVPVFKCSTNPRVATAHRWNAVDALAKLNKPIECFYNKDGKWYYAGIYKAFRLQDLTTKEWEALSTETTQAIIKDTISGRKNTSPQNVYETAQLYAAGALKVACIGLQCVGFNNAMYRAILELANKCAQNGKWRPSPGGLGAGCAWNNLANVNANGDNVSDRVGNTAIDDSENVHGEICTKSKQRESIWPDLV